MNEPIETVDRGRISPMLVELEDFLKRHSETFDAVEVGCALGNAIIWLFQSSPALARLSLAQNYADLVELLAKILEAGAPTLQ